MEILQVREYHEKIAMKKHARAVEESRLGVRGYPQKTMFFFYREDEKGYPTTIRKRGYVVYNEIGATFFLRREDAERVARERGER